MNLDNYQVQSQTSQQQKILKKLFPSLQKQYSQIRGEAKNSSLTSSVTICCRIKRPPGLSNLNSRGEKHGNNGGVNNQDSQRSLNKKGSSNLLNRNSTLRSSAQSLQNRNLMSSSRSIRSSSVHSSASKTNNHHIHNSSAMSSNRAGRSASLLNIYASNNTNKNVRYSLNTQQSVLRSTTTRKKSTRSNLDQHSISAKQRSTRKRNGGGLVNGDRASDCSSVHSSIERLRTPASANSSRKNSFSAGNRTNHQNALSTKRRTENEDPALVSSSRVDKINLSIFGTLEDSPFVVCVPPVHTTQIGIPGKQIRQNLTTCEDLACFNSGTQQSQLYRFDKVVNDVFSQSINCNKLYAKVVKHKIKDQWPKRSTCTLLFGPSDLSKTRKESHLLSSDVDLNLALKTAKDLLSTNAEKRGQQGFSGLIYCSVLQIYQEELTDLLSIPTKSSLKRQQANNAPYFVEDKASRSTSSSSGPHQQLITVAGQICQPIRNMQDMAQLVRVAQQNREIAAKSHFGMSVIDLRKRSHLVVRLIPESISAGQQPVLDFVELCGSDFAASANLASGSRSSEKERIFATNSFNTLSQALLAAAFSKPFKLENHSILTKVLCQSLLSRDAKIIFCTNVGSTAEQLKHSVTALKFSQNIREAIQKRLMKQEQKLTQGSSLEATDNMIHHLNDVEQELYILKQKLYNSNTQNWTGLSQDDPVLSQFADILNSYEERMLTIKETTLKNVNSVTSSQLAPEKAEEIKRGVLEVTKIKNDLSNLRQDIEAAEIEDANASDQKQNLENGGTMLVNHSLTSQQEQIQRQEHPTATLSQFINDPISPSTTTMTPNIHNQQLRSEASQRYAQHQSQSNNQNQNNQTPNSLAYQQIVGGVDASEHQIMSTLQVQHQKQQQLYQNQQTTRPFMPASNNGNGQLVVGGRQQIAAPTPNFLSQQLLNEEPTFRDGSEPIQHNTIGESTQGQIQNPQNETSQSMINQTGGLLNGETSKIMAGEGTSLINPVQDDQEGDLSRLFGQFKDQSGIIGTNFGETNNVVDQSQLSNNNQVGTLLHQRNEDKSTIMNLKQRIQFIEQSSVMQLDALKQQMIALQETNLRLKNSCESNGVQPTFIDNSNSPLKEVDQHAQDMIQMLKKENEKLQKQADSSQKQVEKLQFENESLRGQSGQLQKLYERIDDLQGQESEVAELVKRQAELELHVIQQQSHVEIALKDKRQSECDLDLMRDKLKEILKEKIQIENNFNMIQRHELTRLNELEHKFAEISKQYLASKEEVAMLRKTELDLRNELEQTEQARRNFKEQYFEMREVNKELKQSFTAVQAQIDQLTQMEHDDVRGTYEQRNDNIIRGSHHRLLDNSYGVGPTAGVIGGYHFGDSQNTASYSATLNNQNNNNGKRQGGTSTSNKMRASRRRSNRYNHGRASSSDEEDTGFSPDQNSKLMLSSGNERSNERNKRQNRERRVSDKENQISGGNRRRGTTDPTDQLALSEIEESQREDRSFRKRQNMLSDIQAMIVDYKKKAQYANLISGTEPEGQAQPQVVSIKKQLEAEHQIIPQSRLTYRTGDSFDVSLTSRSPSRSRSQLSRSQNNSRSPFRPTANHNLYPHHNLNHDASPSGQTPSPLLSKTQHSLSQSRSRSRPRINNGMIGACDDLTSSQNSAVGGRLLQRSSMRSPSNNQKGSAGRVARGQRSRSRSGKKLRNATSVDSKGYPYDVIH